MTQPSRTAKRRAHPQTAAPPATESAASAPRSAARAAIATVVLALGLALAVVAAHSPVLRAQAIALDDQLFVATNPLVNRPGWDSARRFFVEVTNPSTVSAYYLPLSMTSLMLDAAAGGKPGHLQPFHVTNLTLHVLATVLLFLLLRRLFGCAIPAALVALLYGVHPLMVEPIASAGERKTVLATALAFACVLAHVHWAQDRSRGGRAASIALFTLALLAKPSVLALPVALLVLDAWPLGRFSRASVVEKWPHFLLAVASAVIAVLAVQRTWELDAPPPLEPMRMALQVCWLLAFYLSKLAWPVDLSPVYGSPEPFELSNPVVAASALAMVALTLALLAARRRARPALAGWTAFVALLVPTFGILPWSPVIAYDRYLHLPVLGLALAAGYALTRAWTRPRLANTTARSALIGFVLLLAGAEAAATRITAARWRDSLTLWKHVVRVSPNVPSAHNGLGATYSDLGETTLGMDEFRRAIEVGPHYVDAHENLGRDLASVGRMTEALPHLEFAAQHSPRSPVTALRLGAAYQRMSRFAEAAAQFRRALALRPGYVPALTQLGVVEVVQGHEADGLAHLRQALALSPGEPLVSYSLASALLQVRGPSAEAVRLLRDALARWPDWAEPMNNLAWLLATAPDPALRDTAEALRLAARAVALAHPPDANTLDTQAAAQAAAGRFAEAVTTARHALALAQAAPDDTLAPVIARRLERYANRQPFVERMPRGH